MRRCLFIILIVFSVLSTTAAHDSNQFPALQAITTHNVKQIQQLARIGEGTFAPAIAWSGDQRWFAVGGSLGIRIYDAKHFEASPRFLDFDQVVYQVGFSPDSQMLAYAAGGMVHLLEVNTWKEVAHFESKTRFAFQPHGRMLALSGYDSNEHLAFWDWQQQMMIGTASPEELVNLLEMSYGSITALALSPDGATLTLSWSSITFDTCGNANRGVQLWDVHQLLAGGTTVQHLADFTLADVSSNQSNALVAALGQFDGTYDGSVSIIDTAKREIQKVLNEGKPIFDEVPDAMTMSPDGRKLALGIGEGNAGSYVRLFDVQSGKELRTLDGAEAYETLAFNPDGNLLAATNDHTVFIWDTQTGQEYAHLNLPALSAQVSPNGTSAILNTSEGPQLFHITEAGVSEGVPLPASYRISDRIYFPPNENWVEFVSAEATDLRLWNWKTGKAIFFDLPKTPHRWAMPGAFSADGKWFALPTEDHAVKIWDLNADITSGSPSFVLDTQPLQPLTVQFSQDSSILLAMASDGTGSRTFQLWNFQNNREQKPVMEFGGYPEATTGTLSPSGQYLFLTRKVQRGGQIYVTDQWQIKRENGYTYSQFMGGFQGREVELNPDETLLASMVSSRESSDIGEPEDSQDITFRDAMTQQVKGQIHYGGFSTGSAVGYRFTPDASRLFTFETSTSNCGNDFNTITFWNTATRQRIAEIPTAAFADVALTADGSIMALGGGWEIRFYDVQTGKELPSQAGHPMAIDHIEFHQSGKLLVTTGEDGTLRVWGVPAV